MDKETVFIFLDDLKESSITNMMGATPYIEDTFDIRKSEAQALLLEWMKSDRHN